MMKLKVYKETKQSMFFELRERECHNGVELLVVNSDGERISRGTILHIDMEGLHLKRSINRDLGLPLDKEGKIKMYSLDEAYDKNDYYNLRR